MPDTPVVLALAGGSFIFLAFVIAFLLARIFGLYTIRGSGINKHPSDGLDGAPGSEGPGQATGKGRGSGTTRRSGGDGETFSSHGTG